MKLFLKKYLLNITIPQEYLCISKEKYADEIKVFLENEKNGIDVSGNHILLGYKPLIISIELQEKFNVLAEKIILKFKTKSGTELAILHLKKITNCNLNSKSNCLYEGIFGEHKFSSGLIQLFQSFHYSISARKNRNIFLDGNLYDQVKIAYSVSRTISLVSVYQKEKLNIFPTDINGKAGDDNYFVSLRLGSKANNQLKESGKMVLCNMNCDEFEKVYNCGKNHMKELSLPEEFSTEKFNSRLYNFPLPEGTKQYYELELADSFKKGIHEIHKMKIRNFEIINSNSATLAHIHRDYIEWRLRNKIPSEYFLR